MQKDWRTVLTWAREQTADGLGAPARVVEAIDRLTSKPRRPRKALSPGKSAADRRKERNERLADLRTRVLMDRAGGRCECCEERPAAHLHHLLSGGLRRHRESYETTIALCESCHDWAHKGNSQTLVALFDWAKNRGYMVAARAIGHRIDKKLEALRRTA